eukprot:7307922-Alexandrium_andersonii.AAC.1
MLTTSGTSKRVSLQFDGRPKHFHAHGHHARTEIKMQGLKLGDELPRRGQITASNPSSLRER